MVNTHHSIRDTILQRHYDDNSPPTSLLERIKIDRATALGLAFCVNSAVLIGLSLPSSSESRLSFLVPEAEPRFEVELRQEQPQQTFEIPPPPTAPVRTPEPVPIIQPILEHHTPMSVPVTPVESSEPPSESASVTQTTTAIPGPPATVTREAGVAYGTAPLPIYPRDALKKGLQGTVVLRVLVSASGSVLEVDVDSSSGHRELDRAAKQQVASRWKFQPALRDGQPVEAWVRVPLVFKLQRS